MKTFYVMLCGEKFVIIIFRMLALLAVGLLPPATNIPTQPLGLPAANIRQHHRVIFQSKGADVLFPQDRMAVSSMLLADDDDVTRTDDEDAAAAKARAELIFGATARSARARISRT